MELNRTALQSVMLVIVAEVVRNEFQMPSASTVIISRKVISISTCIRNKTNTWQDDSFRICIETVDFPL